MHKFLSKCFERNYLGKFSASLEIQGNVWRTGRSLVFLHKNSNHSFDLIVKQNKKPAGTGFNQPQLKEANLRIATSTGL